MAKYCTNGHQMEDEWTDCPYCARTGFQRGGAGGVMDKTRVESATGTAPATASAAADPRKTVLLSTLRRPPVVGWLVAMNGGQKGEDFRLREGQNLIGSAGGLEVTLLNDLAISAKHASIRYRDGAFSLTDLDSTNGTFLNDRTETIAKEDLKDGDVIRVGEISLKFKCL
jgi:Inner membrane component of T3SS, cytoplasmic domain